MNNVRFLDLYLFLILFILVVCKGSTIGDPGVGWHLKNGESIVASLQIPKVDQFLDSQSPLAWVSDQWAADVIFYLLLSVGGFSLLHLCCAVLQVTAYGVVLGREIAREAPSKLVAFFILMLVFANGSMQWFCRPVLFSFLLFVVFYKWMRDFSKATSFTGKKLLKIHLKVFLLFALWANVHPGFAIAFIVFAAYFLETLVTRSEVQRSKILYVITLGVVAFVASLFNPYGLALHQSILSLVSSNYFMRLNVEWLPPEFGQNFFAVFYIAVLGVVVTIALIPYRFFRPFDFFAVLLLLILSFMQRRYIPFFAIPMGLFLATSMRAVAEGNARIALQRLPILRLVFRREADDPHRDCLLWSKVFLFCCLFFTLTFGHLPLRSKDTMDFIDTFPKQTIDYLQKSRADGVIFSTPDWGGFIIWHLWPRFRVFIDDRNTLIGEQRYRDFFVIRDAQPGWETLLKENKFDYLLLKPEDEIVKRLQRRRDWHVVEQGSDNIGILFEKVRAAPF